ncbi:MAG: type II toxin-antitoxin system HicB family antitoxin [Bacillota bacterium]|nr:type II toxin-antitoxin system HicB family antitoxin [Bacillota bacterium]
MKHAYPAIFQGEEDGYTVFFPDLPGCITEGDSIEEAIEMAKDALCLSLYDKEVSRAPLPVASNPCTLELDNNCFVSMILVDTEDYRKYYNRKSVKKTLTIPAWLNDLAEKENAPLSRILQDGLKEYLNLTP